MVLKCRGVFAFQIPVDFARSADQAPVKARHPPCPCEIPFFKPRLELVADRLVVRRDDYQGILRSCDCVVGLGAEAKRQRKHGRQQHQKR